MADNIDKQYSPAAAKLDMTAEHSALTTRPMTMTYLRLIYATAGHNCFVLVRRGH